MADFTLGSGDNDTTGTSTDDSIYGGAGNDSILGLGGADRLDGQEGNDRIIGGAGADTLNDSDASGADTLSYATDTTGVTVTINTGASTGSGGDAAGDQIGAGAFEALEGGSGNDVLIGLRGVPFTLYGNGGDDNLNASLTGPTTQSWLDGGIGRDSLLGSGGRDTLFGGDGNDSLTDRTSGTNPNSLAGGAGDDTLVGQTLLSAGATRYTLDGGAGNDSIVSSRSDNAEKLDSISGDSGDDTIVGTGSNNSLAGGSGNDCLTGGAASDSLFGGEDRDTLDGGGGGDSIFGDANDVLSYSRDNSGVIVNLASLSLASGGEAAGDILSGSFGGVAGGTAADRLTAAAGGSSLYGNAGADCLFGAAGDDFIQGGVGSDSLLGGFGNDTLSYADLSGTSGVIVDLGLNRLVGAATGANDSLSGFEAVEGSANSDSLFGTTRNETFDGGGGNDQIAGGTGNDLIVASPGNDSIRGEGGDDTLRWVGTPGAYGNMTIDGDAGGTDVLDLGGQWGGPNWVTGTSGGFTTYTYNDPTTGTTPDSVIWATGIEQVICFYPGTLIATPEGERPVESLAIGDLVLTQDGTALPIRWMGRQTVSTRFGDPLRVLPIRIRAGALADGLPARDLLLSPDHALLVEGVLVQAHALVNGITITRERAVPERFTYHHVELATHDLILAEGVPAESFVDNVDRGHFDNWAEHEALYGHLPSIPEMDRPRAKAQRQVPRRVLATLAARTAIRPTG